MLECKVFKDEEARHGATVAIMNELHMPSHYGWQLKPRLETIRNLLYRAVVAVAYKDGAPVAVVLVRLMRDGKDAYDIAAYCKDQHRRQGITSELITALRAEAVPLPEARTGIAGSQDFWKANGVPCPYSGW
jgi:hypothetical protein